MASTAVVTGAGGFVGASMVARLREEGTYVRAVDRFFGELREPLYETANEFVGLDLREEPPAGVFDADYVFHFAADHGGAGYFYSDADWKAARSNLQIDLNVLAALEPGQRAFFASSACTYPTTSQDAGAGALRETDWGGGPAEQQYGEAKRMSTILMEGARAHDIDARSGIFHTIYGPRQEFEEPRAKFPTALCRKVIQARRHGGPIEIWGDGSQVRTFLYIDDALDRILDVMSKPYAGPINIGSDEEVTILECAEYAAAAAGIEPVWEFDLEAPTGVPHRSADNSTFDRRYGESSLISARDGFTRLYEFMAHLP